MSEQQPSYFAYLEDAKKIERYLEEREAAEASVKAVRELIEKEFGNGKRK